MVALTEKRFSPSQAHERDSPLSDRVKVALMRTAVRAAELYGENLGPSEGRHALRDDNYHNSAQKYIDKARATKEVAKETSDRLQQSSPYRGSINVGELQQAVGKLPEVTRIAQDPKYLYTHPDQQVTHTPYPRR